MRWNININVASEYSRTSPTIHQDMHARGGVENDILLSVDNKENAHYGDTDAELLLLAIPIVSLFITK
jgi:hypothetical protein